MVDLQDHRVKEEVEGLSKEFPPLPTDRKVKVYVDYPDFPTLTDERFELVKDKDQADIIYMFEHFRDFR